ncbi:MAG: Peptidase S8/S53 subtilisin kexin sedolisin [Ignavibacteria bacterium]|nr:MAG: Peptidase S8/S53 subtilisin kexin sedolisin [Ignavibacteria bacterium]
MKKTILLVCALSFMANAQIKLELIKTLNGNSPTDQLSSIVALGDINKDGYDDLALEYYVKSDSSYAKIHFGGDPFDSTKAFVYTNPKPKFIYKGICGGGDINGDGVNDFVVTYLDNTAIHNPPLYEVQVHFGSKSISHKSDFNITCVALWNCLINGDYNGDGYDDIIITTLNYGMGEIKIYFGNKALSQNSNLGLYGSTMLGEFAKITTIVGDVNNDGCDDFLSSANTSTSLFPNAAFLFKGGQFLNFDNSIKFENSGLYGFSNSLGDINNDGYKDFFIYGINRDIFLGGKQIDPKKPFYRSPKWLFNGIGDINKDGYCDYVKYLNEYYELHLGSRQLDTVPVLIMNYLGNKFINIGDINGDGDVDIANNDFYNKNKINIYSAKVGTSINVEKKIPTENQLHQNYPNPFNPVTTISYKLQAASHVTLKVYDVLGREIISYPAVFTSID